MTETRVVIWPPSSSVIGGERSSVLVEIVQPALAHGEASVTSSGIWMARAVVASPSQPWGTTRLTVDDAPAGADSI